MTDRSFIRLAWQIEAIIGLVLTTPRMHGIHHQAERGRTNSNWSSGISWWDRLHGTYRRDAPQDDVRIGVPAYSRPLTIEQLLGLPLGRQRNAWQPDVSS